MNAYVVIMALLIWPLAASAQLKVMISGGFSGPYEKLLPEFERTSGIKVTTGSGSSRAPKKTGWNPTRAGGVYFAE